MGSCWCDARRRLPFAEESPAGPPPTGTAFYVGGVDITLLPVTVAALDAELDGSRERLADELGVRVTEWPPEGGEWDRDAVEFFRRQIDDGSFDPTWGPSYVVRDGLLVASAGFFGPPDADDEVEIGYSVCRTQRGRGIATAAVSQLCGRAASGGCASVRARTAADNAGLDRRAGTQPVRRGRAQRW